jgi:MFS family permease
MILLEIFLANLFLSFHYYLIIYINSSFLAHYFSDSAISALYIIGSVLSLALFLPSSLIIKRVGLFKFLLVSTVIEGLAIISFIFTKNPWIILSAFIIHQAVIALVSFGLDLFFEGRVKGEGRTGRLRTLYLTVGNTVVVLCPLIIAFVVTDGDYRPVYILASLFIIPLLLVLLGGFRHFKTAVPMHTQVLHSIKELWKKKNIRYVTGASLVLQTFYTWMIIYTPIYLNQHLGFSWESIGIMFTIMLLPFILFEIPVGRIADSWLGEQEMMTFGFAVMILALFLFPLTIVPTFFIWTTILFISRIGASFVEATTESYFFKQVNETDADFISIFRATRAMGYIVAPVIAGISLVFIPFRYIFVVFGIFCAAGIYFARKLVDTK